MADNVIKVSDLNVLAKADIENDLLFVIQSSGLTYKITYLQLQQKIIEDQDFLISSEVVAILQAKVNLDGSNLTSTDSNVLESLRATWRNHIDTLSKSEYSDLEKISRPLGTSSSEMTSIEIPSGTAYYSGEEVNVIYKVGTTPIGKFNLVYITEEEDDNNISQSVARLAYPYQEGDSLESLHTIVDSDKIPKLALSLIDLDSGTMEGSVLIFGTILFPTAVPGVTASTNIMIRKINTYNANTDITSIRTGLSYMYEAFSVDNTFYNQKLSTDNASYSGNISNVIENGILKKVGFWLANNLGFFNFNTSYFSYNKDKAKEILTQHRYGDRDENFYLDPNNTGTFYSSSWMRYSEDGAKVNLMGHWDKNVGLKGNIRWNDYGDNMPHDPDDMYGSSNLLPSTPDYRFVRLQRNVSKYWLFLLFKNVGVIPKGLFTADEFETNLVQRIVYNRRTSVNSSPKVQNLLRWQIGKYQIAKNDVYSNMPNITTDIQEYTVEYKAGPSDLDYDTFDIGIVFRKWPYSFTIPYEVRVGGYSDHRIRISFFIGDQMILGERQFDF